MACRLDRCSRGALSRVGRDRPRLPHRLRRRHFPHLSGDGIVAGAAVAGGRAGAAAVGEGSAEVPGVAGGHRAELRERGHHGVGPAEERGDGQVAAGRVQPLEPLSRLPADRRARRGRAPHAGDAGGGRDQVAQRRRIRHRQPARDRGHRAVGAGARGGDAVRGAAAVHDRVAGGGGSGGLVHRAEAAGAVRGRRRGRLRSRRRRAPLAPRGALSAPRGTGAA